MATTNWGACVTAIKDDFVDSLKELKRDEYVAFCLGNPELRKFTEQYVKKVIRKIKPAPKSSEVALAKKNEGNKKYEEKKFEESVALYTESIFNGPKNDETVPLSYSNRSLALFHMGRYLESLQDIEMALRSGYQDDKAWKLLIRKARCLARLGEYDKARNVLIECAKEPYSKKCIQNISSEITMIEFAKGMSISKKVKYELPKLAGGENKNFANASNYISIFYSNNKGRHVIANRDIKIGDVLFVEKAFTFVLQKQACHTCCIKSLAPIPCWNCLDVSYCSPECRDKDWKQLHHLECGYIGILKYLGIAYLALKIALTVSPKFENFKKVLKEVKEHKFKEGQISWPVKGYEAVYNLVTHTEKYGPSDLFHFVMSAVLLTMHIKMNTKYFSDSSTDDDLKVFANAVWRHIMQMICNCYAIVDCFEYTEEGKMVVTSTEERLGSAVYPSACIMNHSCEPSVIYSFFKDYFIVRAAKEIKKGEEVYSCYGAYAKIMKKSEREQIIRKQYFFRCKCEHCRRNFDLQDKFTALKCPHCEGPLVPKGIEESRTRFCLDCKKTLKVSAETMEKKDLMHALFAEGNDLVATDIQSALWKYLTSWRLAREIFYKFNQDLTFAADQAAMCLVELKDYKRAASFVNCCLMSVEKRFGEFSIEVAGESSKFGDILYNCALNCKDCTATEKREKAREGVKWYERAEKIYSLLYSPYYRELDEIRNNKRRLQMFYTTGMFFGQ